MVPPERFELPTPGFVIQCSIQLSQGGKKLSRDEAVKGLYGHDLEAGDRFELPMHLAYETGVVTALPAIFCSTCSAKESCADLKK